MRKALVVLLAVGCLAATAHAQVKFGAGPHLGFAFSSFPKPADQYYGFGFGFGAQGEVEFIKYVSMRLNFDYLVFSADKAKFGYTGGGQPIPTSDISGGNAKSVSITVTGLGKIPTASSFTPYGMFGFGLYIGSVSDISVTYQGKEYPFPTGDSKTNFGIHFGVRSEFKVSHAISVFGDFKFVLVFSEGSSTSVFPFTFGMNYWF